MKTKIDIPAIHDKDLKNILEELGFYDKFEKGELFCGNCNRKITWENLFALKKINTEIILFCDEIDCIENTTDK